MARITLAARVDALTAAVELLLAQAAAPAKSPATAGVKSPTLAPSVARATAPALVAPCGKAFAYPSRAGTDKVAAHVAWHHCDQAAQA